MSLKVNCDAAGFSSWVDHRPLPTYITLLMNVSEAILHNIYFTDTWISAHGSQKQQQQLKFVKVRNLMAILLLVTS